MLDCVLLPMYVWLQVLLILSDMQYNQGKVIQSRDFSKKMIHPGTNVKDSLKKITTT